VLIGAYRVSYAREPAFFRETRDLNYDIAALDKQSTTNSTLEKIMKIARFEPWPAFDLLRSELSPAAPGKTTSSWVPAVDIIEHGDHFVLRADVPGVNPDDIEVSMDAGVLTLSGIRHAEEIGEDVSAQRTERASGNFVRRFTLPETTNAEEIRAKSRNGILDVTIPKLPEIQARRIAVEAA
jgi:HSP20 family protein